MAAVGGLDSGLDACAGACGFDYFTDYIELLDRDPKAVARLLLKEIKRRERKR